MSVIVNFLSVDVSPYTSAADEIKNTENVIFSCFSLNSLRTENFSKYK